MSAPSTLGEHLFWRRSQALLEEVTRIKDPVSISAKARRKQWQEKLKALF